MNQPENDGREWLPSVLPRRLYVNSLDGDLKPYIPTAIDAESVCKIPTAAENSPAPTTAAATSATTAK